MTLQHVPLLRLDLSDGGRSVGWIRGRTIGFRGFHSAADAATGAWVAYGTVARRLARGTGGGPIPGVVEPLTFRSFDGHERILADGREIGTLVRPGAGSRDGTDSFGFEIEVPAPADELRMRSMAHLIYRTLRRSGVRWSAPVPELTPTKPSIPVARKHRATATPIRGGTIMYNPNRRGMNTSIPMSTSLPPPASVSSGTTFVSRFLLGAIAIVATIGLILAAPLSVTGPLGFVFLAGLSGTFLLSALERRRQRRDRSSRLPGRVTGAHDASSRDADPAGRTPSASGALAIFSISMLGVALFAPVSLGVGVAVVGLVGLFALRISAMVTGWAPSGAAWAGPRRSNPLPALG